MARPLKQVDENLLENLAALGCTNEEMAPAVGISADTITKRYSELVEAGRNNGKRSIRRQQFRMAMGYAAEYERDKRGDIILDGKGRPIRLKKEQPPDSRMLIWLGKSWLKQNEFSGDEDEDWEI